MCVEMYYVVILVTITGSLYNNNKLCFDNNLYGVLGDPCNKL